MNLEALRKKRRARMVSDTKKSISDYAGPRRIYFIYKRCLVKFKGDISIWLQYIDYAKKTGATRTLGKIFAQAIQLHPTNEKMWILAAAWEWEENANIVAARGRARPKGFICMGSATVVDPGIKMVLTHDANIVSLTSIE